MPQERLQWPIARTVCNISVIHNQITDPDKVVEVLCPGAGA